VLTFRRPSRVFVRATTALVALFVVGSSLWASLPVQADTKSKLAAAEAALKRIIADAASAARQRDILQGQLDVLASKIDANQGSMEQTQANIIDAQKQIQKLAREILAQQSVLDQRAKEAFESGAAGSLEFFLGAQSMTDLQDRIQIVSAAAESDRSLIDGMTESRNNLHNKETRLQSLESSLRKKQAELESWQRALDEKFAEQSQLMTRLANDQSNAESLISQLKAQLHREYLEALRRAEERRRQQQSAPPGGLGGGGGNWVPGIIVRCPVAGSHAYSDSFGAPRYSGGYHPHAGNDIMSPGGTPIVAPFDGVAVDGSNGLGGLTVVVTGSQGYVYNAHLERYGATGHVSAGTVIGYVGDTGDAQGGATHDHFEWHPNQIPSNPWRSPYGYTVIGDAVDPYPYLNAVC
jgi:peptidoglycan LD-endopeptidase LytH